MRILRIAAVALLASTAALCQNPPANFELILPDLSNRVISGGANVAADIPPGEIDRLTIQMLGPADANLSYGEVRVRINGKGARDLFRMGSNTRGKVLSMDPASLRKVHDQYFDSDHITIEVYGKGKNGRDFYQNWILRSGHKNPSFTYVSTKSPEGEEGVVPDLDIELPKASVVWAPGCQPSPVRLKGSVSAADGIRSLTLGGTKVGKVDGAQFSFDQNVAVAKDAREIVVEVVNRKGNRRSVSIPVICPAPLTAPARLVGEAWAVVIGIGRFKAQNGPPTLGSATIDAEELARALGEHGIRPDNIRLLVDNKATVEQVRTALGDFTAKAKPEDFLLVYYSTQGLHDPASPEKVYLAASDTQISNLSDTALDIEELRLLLGTAVRSRHTLLFFDAEHPLGAEWRFPGSPLVNTLLLNLFDGAAGRSVMVAGASKPSSGRSAFATALIEGLSGRADLDQDHALTAREISAYVVQRVREVSGGAQQARAMVPKSEEEQPLLGVK